MPRRNFFHCRRSVRRFEQRGRSRQAAAGDPIFALQPLDERRRERVLALLKRHSEQTGSAVADALLAAIEADPETAWGRFTHLIPRDYARVLEIHEVARSEGRDPDGDHAWSQILEVTRG